MYEQTTEPRCSPRGFTTTIEGASKTRQEFAEDANINTIMARWTVNRGPTWKDIRSDWQEGRYGDFSSALDLTEAIALVDSSRRAFEQLPAKVRAAAGHDPRKFLEMVDDADQVEELVAAGLEIEGVPQKAVEASPAAEEEPAGVPAPPQEEAPPAAE